MIGGVALFPGRPGRGHLDHATADAPDIAGAAVILPPEHLGRHVGDGAQQLALELPRKRVLLRQLRCSSQIAYSQVLPRTVHKEVCTWTHRKTTLDKAARKPKENLLIYSRKNYSFCKFTP